MSIRSLGGLLAGVLLATSLVPSGLAGAAGKGLPHTEFERSDGGQWTSLAQERRFLQRVDRMAQRMKLERVGRSSEGRPLNLAKIGVPGPHSARESQRRPTVLFVCSQHGDEPAGREACLSLIRDLSFTYGSAYVDQLEDMTVLVMPTTNPDGIASGTHANANGIDVAKDHLNLRSREARAIARVTRTWRPDVVLDLHETHETESYDSEVLYVWPRNLNVDDEIHDRAVQLGDAYVRTQAEANGYSAQGYEADELADSDPHRSEDEDEGLLPNAMGLRNALGLFVETAIDPAGSASEWNLRRVDSHYVVALAVLQYLRREGEEVAAATAAAARRKTAEGRDQSAPVYFDGTDEEAPTEVQDPPPCGYLLTQKQFKHVGRTMALLDIAALGSMEGVFVPMGQPAEPLIPLLLDSRGRRHEVAAQPQMTC